MYGTAWIIQKITVNIHSELANHVMNILYSFAARHLVYTWSISLCQNSRTGTTIAATSTPVFAGKIGVEVIPTATQILYHREFIIQLLT